MTGLMASTRAVLRGVSLICRLFHGLAEVCLIFVAYFGLVMSLAFFGSDFPSDAQALLCLETSAFCLCLILALSARLERQSRVARHTAAIIRE